MIVIVILAMIFFSFLGVWFKRRHQAKLAAQRGIPPVAGDQSGRNSRLSMPYDNTHGSGSLSQVWKAKSGSGIFATSAAVAAAAMGRSESRNSAPGGFQRARSGTTNSTNAAYPPITGPQFLQAQTKGYEYPAINEDSIETNPSRSTSPLAAANKGKEKDGGIASSNSASMLHETEKPKS